MLTVISQSANKPACLIYELFFFYFVALLHLCGVQDHAIGNYMSGWTGFRFLLDWQV